VDVIRRQGGTGGQPHFDVGAASQVHGAEAGGKRGRIVCDHEIARLQEIDEPRSRRVRHASLRIDHEEPGVRRPLDRSVGGSHARVSSSVAEPGA